METLVNLFGSEARVKIMRLFLFNPEGAYDIKEIAAKTKTRPIIARKELKLLEKAHLIKKRSIKKKGRRKKVKGWAFDPEFVHLTALQNLLVNVTSLQHSDILKKLGKIGHLRVVVLSGVFIQDWDSRADILVVADKIKMRVLNNFLKHLEAEIGREMKYVALSTSEFQYRWGMGDKLLRDIMDYQHEVALDRLGIS